MCTLSRVERESLDGGLVTNLSLCPLAQASMPLTADSTRLRRDDGCCLNGCWSSAQHRLTGTWETFNVLTDKLGGIGQLLVRKRGRSDYTGSSAVSSLLHQRGD